MADGHGLIAAIATENFVAATARHDGVASMLPCKPHGANRRNDGRIAVRFAVKSLRGRKFIPCGRHHLHEFMSDVVFLSRKFRKCSFIVFCVIETDGEGMAAETIGRGGQSENEIGIDAAGKEDIRIRPHIQTTLYGDV